MTSGAAMLGEMSGGLAERGIELSLRATEAGWVPDRVIRLGIREICRRRLRGLDRDPEAAAVATAAFVASMRRAPIAVLPHKANDQHYEVPASLFELMLGPHRKYSCCYFEHDGASLAEAELAALARTCDNAELVDGHRILELGCGWGSLTLYMAERYPAATITAVSNSSRQRRFIMGEAARRGLHNVDVITCDVNELALRRTFDRVVSVEMFEHVRNHESLLARIASMLVPGGKLLVHIFCTGGPPYAFEDEGADDWMARNFFSGGVMPSDDLLLRYQRHLTVERHWRWSGRHYERTAEAWLGKLDRRRAAAEEILRSAGAACPQRAVQRWRMFFMACAEMFGFDEGTRWWVSHYRFVKGAA